MTVTGATQGTWGERQLSGEKLEVEFGCLKIELERHSQGVELSTRSTHGPATRLLIADLGDTLRFVPAPPDRPLVLGLVEPVELRGGATFEFSMSLPIWLRIETGAHVLLDQPLARLRETFFGPSTREGRFAYWQEANCLSAPKVAPERALCPITLINRADKVWRAGKLIIPAPSLPLYLNHDNTLQTAQVMIERDSDLDLETRIERQPPPEGARLIGKARVAAANVFERALQEILT